MILFLIFLAFVTLAWLLLAMVPTAVSNWAWIVAAIFDVVGLILIALCCLGVIPAVWMGKI